MVGATRRAALPSATIHPVRCLSKGLSSSNIRGFVPESQDPGWLSNGAGLKRNAAGGFFTKPSNFPTQTEPSVAARTDQVDFATGIFLPEAERNVKPVLVPAGRAPIDFTFGFEPYNLLFSSISIDPSLQMLPPLFPGPIPEFSVEVFQIPRGILGIILGVHVDPGPMRSPKSPTGDSENNFAAGFGSPFQRKRP